ncbi:MAG TPA: membrane dipeptidase [Fulvivirga sp.]|nr:membrane dipeptidase [Fulvivirga sp.]
MTPVIDLHCDLLSYLNHVPDATPYKTEEIGASFPALEAGNVKLQVMAIYTASEKGSTESALKQSLLFKKLLTEHADRLALAKSTATIQSLPASTKTNMLAAIENASGICEEDDKLADGFKNLETIISNTEKILYIGLTHHAENRFGGGNNTKVGLKEDGKALLDYINGRKIAIDFSHTSDALAHDILNYLTQKNLDIPILASHSNFRPIFDHPRNLPDDIAMEIINQGGLIGMNFLRAFMNNDDPNALYDHIAHGLSLGGANSICFGADFFYTGNHPDQSRRPFYFKEHENASCYPALLKELTKRTNAEQVEAISHKNVANYIQKIWS